MYQTITKKFTKEKTIEIKMKAEGIDETYIINYKMNSHNGISS